jgi:hypothetical protein
MVAGPNAQYRWLHDYTFKNACERKVPSTEGEEVVVTSAWHSDKGLGKRRRVW